MLFFLLQKKHFEKNKGYAERVGKFFKNKNRSWRTLIRNRENFLKEKSIGRLDWKIAEKEKKKKNIFVPKKLEKSSKEENKRVNEFFFKKKQQQINLSQSKSIQYDGKQYTVYLLLSQHFSCTWNKFDSQ